ncbi:MAG: hypothetical protein GOVbin2277_51 [Prokaryotic dsDNA virus sp.]|jgi:hypothetical protein|nr:MAG: hypothetical protein GOVbin2277_51 [Prokaryotic dsDNA virus sp.]|tara:strand:+ start:89 stop:496 length:408 start_codon:yes stop_codon:yes gene_type:complete
MPGLSTLSIPKRLAETVLIDTTTDSTAENNVFDGITLATKIYCLKIDNSAINAVSYLKGQISSGQSYDTATAPTIRLYAPANQVVEYYFPTGWPANELSGSDKFHFIGTSTDSSTGTQADPIAPGTLKVTILAGT